jgi:hypothetical protein
MFSLTRSNLLRQLPDLNEIIRRFMANCERYQFNRNIFLATAITTCQRYSFGEPMQVGSYELPAPVTKEKLDLMFKIARVCSLPRLFLVKPQSTK